MSWPKGRRQTLLLAVVGTGLVVAAAVVIFLAGDRAPVGAGEVVQMDVVTRRYVYEPGTEPRLEVPLGARVLLDVSSADVTHGFAIEGYGVNKEIPAGETVRIEFVAGRAGDFRIYCTVFCGSGHPEHKGTLHVA